MFNAHKKLEAFKDVIRSGKFLVLDTETTGLHDGEICQISIIRSDGSGLLDCLVKPTRPIPADASRIHGIYDADVQDAPSWQLLAPRVLEMIQGQDVVIYNAVYDRKMMHQSAEKAGMEKIDWKTHARFHCAMEAFAEIYGDWNSYHGNYRWQKLTTAASYYGIPVQNAHSALGDCLMTLAVVKAMIAEVQS
jgi:DNA polymerase III subunit epsilon